MFKIFQILKHKFLGAKFFEANFLGAKFPVAKKLEQNFIAVQIRFKEKQIAQIIISMHH